MNLLLCDCFLNRSSKSPSIALVGKCHKMSTLILPDSCPSQQILKAGVSHFFWKPSLKNIQASSYFP